MILWVAREAANRIPFQSGFKSWPFGAAETAGACMGRWDSQTFQPYVYWSHCAGKSFVLILQATIGKYLTAYDEDPGGSEA